VHIVVPIKQIPDTQDVQMDPETGTMVRSGVTAVVNPLDLYAVTAALDLRRTLGGTITAVTMGPPQAEEALREVIALGCDAGVLVSDRRFGGSDTWATSRTLAAAIRKLGEFDLIITGERATDGDTGQVGPGIAAWLDIPVATYVARIHHPVSTTPPADRRLTAESPAVKSLTVERLTEDGYQLVELSTPALLTVVKEVASPGLPTLSGKRIARSADIPVFDAARLELDHTTIGLAGSPTRVARITTPRVSRQGAVATALDDTDVPKAVDALVAFLREKELI